MVVVLEAVLCVGWAQQGWGAVQIDLPLLIDAAFAAGAAMISFGAVLGKASPAQALWLLALQVPLYAANAQVGARGGGGCDLALLPCAAGADCWTTWPGQPKGERPGLQPRTCAVY